MINVNQITAQLARMPDQALQQYAQMHKGDPYTLSLALAESNRRKQMRQGAQMSVPEQPKVVDQAVQGMAAPMPEDVGIAQLPSGDMNYAEGGIVAFSDGGDVPRYNGSQGSLLKGTEYDIPGMTQSDLYAKAVAKARADTGRDPTAEDIRKALAFVSAPLAAAADVVTSPLTLLRRGLTMPLSEAATKPPSFTPAMDMRNEYLFGKKKQAAPAPLASPDADFPSAARTRAAAPKPDIGARGPGTRQPAAPAGGPGAAPASDQSIYSLASTPSTYQREFNQFLPQGKVADPFEADVREQGAAEEKAARDYAAQRKAQLEAMGLMGLEQEKRLKAREEKLGKQEGELSGMALLQAGFAMMAGASPNALQNIGVGAQAGLKKYGEGIERLDAAREKIDDAFGRLEIARRSEKMLTDKELAELERDANKVASQTKREVLNSARTAYGLSHAQAGKMFDAYVADKRLGAELGSRERISREDRLSRERVAAAGRPENLYTALGSAAPGSPLRKGFEMTKEADKIPRLYGEYTKLVADPMNGSAFEQKFPTFEAFLSAMGGSRSAGFVTPPKDAPVLKPPGGR